MQIKFQGTLVFIDGSQAQTFSIPNSGDTVGLNNITEKDADREFTLIGGSSDVALGFGNINSAGLIILVVEDQAISIKLNTTGGSPIQIGVDAINDSDTKYGVFVLTGTSVSEIYMSNSGSGPAKIKLFLGAK